VSIEKIEELKDAVHPLNVPEGTWRTSIEFKDDNPIPVKVGERVHLSNFITSKVIEVLEESESKSVFKTLNSIYVLKVKAINKFTFNTKKT
jgi:hypothetical protein